jgi:hypothetical protein
LHALVAGLIASLSFSSPGESAPVPSITVDRRHHTVTIVVGPFDLPSMPPELDHAMHEENPGTLAHEFIWPENGWFRGFRSEILDARGGPLPHELLHHFTLLNYDRRSLFSPVAERLAAAALEHKAVAPKTIGAPMQSGQRLGLYVMWRNQTGQDLGGVYLKLTLISSPANLLPRPVNALPVVLDVNFRPGYGNTFDVPPGRSERSSEVVFPISGRLIAVGGHLHDQGEAVRLEDAETGRVLVNVRARRDADGTVHGVSRRLLALWGRGLHVKAGRRYRVVAVYNNIRPDTVRHVMGELITVFAPDDMRQWLPVDHADPTYLADLAHYGAVMTPEQAEHERQHHMP